MTAADEPMDAFRTGPEHAPTGPSPPPDASGRSGPDWSVWTESLRTPPAPPPAGDGAEPEAGGRPLLVAAVVEAAVVLAFYQWYAAARHWVTGSDGAAHANARRLIDVEAAFGFFNEEAIQAAVLARPWLIELFAAHYALFHFAVPVVAFVVLFRRDRVRFYLYRRVFAFMSVLAVVCFALWPLLPPRFLPEPYGFVDVLASVSRQPSVDHGFAPALYNGVAAMPSLHVGYALWSALALWPVVSRRARTAVATHLVVTLVAVVVTGNHYHLDSAGAAALLPIAVFLAHRIRMPALAAAHVSATVALVAAALVIWLPKGLFVLAAQNLILAAVVTAVAGRFAAAPAAAGAG